MEDLFPVLYILMRNDLDSMNSGKAMAQASHASNAFVHHMHDKTRRISVENDMLFTKWTTETRQGFGTVIVLTVNEHEMQSAIDVASRVGLVAGVVHDPTYPLLDGDIVHYIPLDTCGYVFGNKDDTILRTIIGNFPLHP